MQALGVESEQARDLSWAGSTAVGDGMGRLVEQARELSWSRHGTAVGDGTGRFAQQALGVESVQALGVESEQVIVVVGAGTELTEQVRAPLWAIEREDSSVQALGVQSVQALGVDRQARQTRRCRHWEFICRQCS